MHSIDHDLYTDSLKGKSSEIHLTSSEVRAGSKIESSLLYEQPLLGLEEKCANKVNKILTMNLNKYLQMYHYPYLICVYSLSPDFTDNRKLL